MAADDRWRPSMRSSAVYDGPIPSHTAKQCAVCQPSVSLSAQSAPPSEHQRSIKPAMPGIFRGTQLADLPHRPGDLPEPRFWLTHPSTPSSSAHIVQYPEAHLLTIARSLSLLRGVAAPARCLSRSLWRSRAPTPQASLPRPLLHLVDWWPSSPSSVAPRPPGSGSPPRRVANQEGGAGFFSERETGWHCCVTPFPSAGCDRPPLEVGCAVEERAARRAAANRRGGGTVRRQVRLAVSDADRSRRVDGRGDAGPQLRDAPDGLLPAVIAAAEFPLA